jgi:putative ABC transport system ATP-binding protein
MPPSGTAEQPAGSSPLLALRRLTVERRESPSVTRRILDAVSLTVEPGAIIAVTGPSGAGKTTLLHAAAGLLRPDAGSVRWGTLEVTGLGEAACDRWRRDSVGLVLQDFQLIAELDVLDNILLPVRFDSWRATSAVIERASRLAGRVGLDRRATRASALSRGEQQRVAIARALMRHPRIILADEPTASLDSDNSARIVDLLIACAREERASVLVASHDARVLARATCVHRLASGALQAEP